MRPSRGLVLGLAVMSGCIATTGMAPGRPAAGPMALQVPYVAQSELLCGGAAIAMVERWWGRRGVYAEEFASLVHPGSGGILTTDMVLATRARGWQARAVRGTPALVRESLRDSVPVIALIRVAANRYHYVVIVGWDSIQVIFHDPAVGPFRTLGTSAFVRRWSGADQWMMIIPPPVPLAAVAIERDDQPAVETDSMPCRPWLDQAADAVAVNRLDDADHLLAAAATACPSEPLVLRELAGVRFQQGRRAEAMQLADEYLRRAPTDALGWQLLASSRYLAGDANGALRAWNTIGRPAIDLVHVDGIRRIRFRPLADAVDLSPGMVLTPARLALAQRRVADIPALALARMTYAAVPGGVVEVRAAVVERPLIEPIPLLLLSGVIRAAVHNEVDLAVTTPIGAGEQWTMQWRWEPADPREAVRLDLPARVGLPGIVDIESSWEQYHFSTGSPDRQRRAATLGFGSWLQPNVEALTGVRFERWSGQGDFIAFSLGGAVHGLRDRVVLIAEAEQAVPLTDDASYARARARVAWRSPAGRASTAWSIRMGIDWASGGAPGGLWSVAGGDLTREIPLRAHPFIVDDALVGEQTGRSIPFGGVAGDRPIGSIGPVILAVGVFLDAATVGARGQSSVGAPWYVDGGAGLTVGLPGAKSGALRIDLARGFLADPRWALNVGFEQPWPPRLRGFQ